MSITNLYYIFRSIDGAVVQRQCIVAEVRPRQEQGGENSWGE